MNSTNPISLRISAIAKHHVPSVSVRTDTLIWVRSGEKRLYSGPLQINVRSDMIVLLPRGTQWSLVNDPMGSKRYIADILEFGDSAISLFHEMYGSDFPIVDVNPGSLLHIDTQLSDSLQACLKTQNTKATSSRMKIHHAVEILILLAERGFVFPLSDALNIQEKVRRLVAQAPHADWNVNRISKIFHVSESTLRRRFSEFGVTVHALINEVRLNTALRLLQTTALAVGEISRRCGYESHSRFSAAFRSHFGYAPSQLRNSATKESVTSSIPIELMYERQQSFDPIKTMGTEKTLSASGY